MKNEVGERREARVLYEPPEPLFPDLPVRRIRLSWRIAAGVLVVAAALIIWMLAASAIDSGENDGTGQEEKTDQTNAHNGGYPSEHESEKDSDLVEQMTTESSEIVETDPKEPEGESEPIEPLPPAVIEADLSEAERGDEYIINYTDKVGDISGLLDRGFVDIEAVNSASPIVMIVHTHTSEGYFGGDNPYLDGVVSIGDRLSRRLNELGLTALHCTVINDDGENNAYLNARKTIETMLRIYPSIKYVIDLHRLELESGGIPIKTISARRDGASQIRLTVSADGEGWQENLSLALSLRKKLNENGDRICMPPTLSPSRYNSDLTRYYLMADVGSTGNTAAEAGAAADRLAKALADTILEK